MKRFDRVMVIGGGGYVGAVLIPKLLESGYRVKVFDLFMYGQSVLEKENSNPNLTLVQGDVRNIDLLSEELKNHDAVIHLACISNDPSFELNPNLARSINYDCFEPCVKSCKENGVKRFIYASSSSVYGVKETNNVTEDMDLNPLTDYSKFKALCEGVVLKHTSSSFPALVLRPATVCGCSPRQRLDVIVNILTNHAVNTRKIKVFGGEQLRPNIHIDDMADLYIKSLEYEDEKINGKIYNAGYENSKVMDLALLVKSIIGQDVAIETVPTDDNRSYHISSERIKNELGFEPSHTIKDAVFDLKQALDRGEFADPMNNPMYFNIKRMKEINLQ